MMDKKAQSDIRLIVGIALLLFGAAGSVFFGLGISFANTTLTFIGEIILSLIAILVLIIQKVFS